MNSNHFYSLLQLILMTNIGYVFSNSEIPVLSLNPDVRYGGNATDTKFMPFMMLIEKDQDTSEFWRETDILAIVRNREADIDYGRCEQSPESSVVHFATRRTVRPICRTRIDYQLCPQCSHFNNHTECELFRDSCTCGNSLPKETDEPEPFKTGPRLVKCSYVSEKKVHPSDYRTYCDQKYGKYRTMFLPADYSQCRCCDECIFYRADTGSDDGMVAKSKELYECYRHKLDQSCMSDEYSFDSEEFLPVTTLEYLEPFHPEYRFWLDFRAGCNPYLGHPDQELKALRCDKVLRRCVPVSVPALPKESLNIRRSYRFEPPTDGSDCPDSCRGYECHGGLVKETECVPGAFLPDKKLCNCCGRCSTYHQLNEKCAEFKKTVHMVNGSKEIEVEEEFLEPGCDDGLVCRQGRCQDIHAVQPNVGIRTRRDGGPQTPNAEPCKQELKYFKKKYGPEGHLHFNAPQCTQLWLYAPVQCRRFVCYCALEDGTFIEGIKVPRVEVSNMNCDCAREKCRTKQKLECDGYGNYKEAMFTPHIDNWADADIGTTKTTPPASATTSDEPDTTDMELL